MLLLWILSLALHTALHLPTSISDPRATEAATICSNRTAAASDRRSQIANYFAAVDDITTKAFRQGYGRSTVGTGPTAVYAFAECMKDLSADDCSLCLAQLKVQTTKCRPFQNLTKGGTLFYDGCFLRYEDYSFFDEVVSSPLHRIVCGGGGGGGEGYVRRNEAAVFGEAVLDLGREMSAVGPGNDGFYTGLVRRGNLSVYGLAQCWEYVNRSGCVGCLENSVSRMGSCRPNREGRVLNAGCYLRYSTTRFYNRSGSDAHTGNGGGHLSVILASTFGAAAFLVLVAFISFSARKKALRQRRAKKNLGALFPVVNKSRINYSYETLERATNYFHISNKLGQGGSGSVYKGTLPGGQIIAVKRLMFNTTQWADHFFNEVNLISGINHKNLVKLLGCSITGPESLLVYEYVPNQSLHDHLFGKKNVLPRLGWEQRSKIILDVAEGLAYLHEESNLRIIHRDIKLSNILLDDNLTAKIADFGLARLFPEDKSHISTAIAGTLGYMAPEYIVRGKLTEKADVYSFGVLVIEVICGTKNNAFDQGSYSILQKVWNLYGTGKLIEAVDSSIKTNFPEEKSNRLLRIGLTCVQADAELRPSMSLVVKMITGKHELFSPAQPPFLSSSSSEMTYPPGTYYYQPDTYTVSSGNEITESFLDPR